MIGAKPSDQRRLKHAGRFSAANPAAAHRGSAKPSQAPIGKFETLCKAVSYIMVDGDRKIQESPWLCLLCLLCLRMRLRAHKGDGTLKRGLLC